MYLQTGIRNQVLLWVHHLPKVCSHLAGRAGRKQSTLPCSMMKASSAFAVFG